MRFHRPLPRLLPYLVAAAWLTLGFSNLLRGVAHAGPPYRRWAFDHHSYSDLLAMAGDRYFRGAHPLPYLQDRIEYPVLLGLALYWPSLVPGGPAAYFTAAYLFLAACAFVAVALLMRMPGTRPFWLAATPALAYYGGLNWDLLPVALLLAAVLAFERARPMAAGSLVALGVSAKLWPVALAPPAAALLLRRGEGTALHQGIRGALLSFLVVNLPFLLLAPANWGFFWRFNAARGAENSAFELLRLWPRLAWLTRDAATLNVITLGLLAAAVALAAHCAWRAGPAEPPARLRVVRLGTAFVIVAWIATAKVWSPQYALWAFAAGALSAAPAWLFALHAVVAPLDYHVAFEVRSSRGIIRFDDPVYFLEEGLRCAAYLLLAAWLARALWRAAREARESGTGHEGPGREGSSTASRSPSFS